MAPPRSNSVVWSAGEVKKWRHSGATFSLRLQTIQQSLDQVVPPDISMVCGADNSSLWATNLFIAGTLMDFGEYQQYDSCVFYAGTLS